MSEPTEPRDDARAKRPAETRERDPRPGPIQPRPDNDDRPPETFRIPRL